MSVLRVNELKALKAKEENEKNRLLVLQAVRLRRMEEARRKKRPHQKVKVMEKEVVTKSNRGRKRRLNQNKKKAQKQSSQPKAIQMLDQLAWNHAVANGGVYTPGKFDLDKHELERYAAQSKEAGLQKRGGRKRTNPKRLRRTKDGDEADWWSPLLEMGGKLAVDVLPKILAGVGDYEEEPGILSRGEIPESNSFVAAATKGEQGVKTPVVHSDGQTIRVANREYLGDVYSTTDKFSTVTFPINPGMNEWGPWGSPIANQYTNYTMLGAVAQFVTEASDYANVAGLGYVALATQYNSLAPVFTDKREMFNSLFADAVKPSLSMTHCIECDPSVVRDADLFVRAGDVPANADPRLYDLGRLTLAVGGNTASAAVLGELWISYDVLLHIPKMTGSSALNNLFYSARTAGVVMDIPMGVGAPSVNSRSTFRMAPVGNTLAFPPHLRGDFLIECFWIPTSPLSGAHPPTAVLTNCSVVSSFVAVTNPGFSTTGATSVGYRNTVSVNTDGAYITWTSGTGIYVNGTTTGEITVMQVPKAVSVSPIFDVAGRNYDARYDAFMDQFRKTDDKFSDETFSVEKESGDFALMVKEGDLMGSRTGPACYLKQKSLNIKTALPFKVAPWLRSMSEKQFLSACVEISKIPIHSQFFFDDVIHACCAAKENARQKKDYFPNVHYFDNAHFDEKDAPTPNIHNGRVRYAPNYKPDYSSEASEPPSGYSEDYKRKVAKRRPQPTITEEDGSSSSE
jgi:hypothetical protein